MKPVKEYINKESDLKKDYDLFDSVTACTIAYDTDHNELCWFYYLDGLGIEMIKQYYLDNNLNQFDIHVHNKNIRNRSQDAKDIEHLKICVLNGTLVTYQEIKDIAETVKLKGYKKGKLKKTLNIFSTSE